MEAFRFILENPHPGAAPNKQRKRARLVTACDSCRVKKIKCQQPVPNGCCEACRIAKTPCLFGDRDRYQAERGVTCTWNSSVEDIPDIPDIPLSSSRKRKLNPVSDPSPASASPPPPLRSISRASSASQSRSVTPAGPSVLKDRYIRSEQHAGPSVQHGLSVFGRPMRRPHTRDVLLPSYRQVPIFDPHRPRFPHPYRMRQLATVFFDNLGSLFPFLDRYDVLHRIEQQTCSAILSNCIAGLASRYVDPDLVPCGTAYYDNAKSLAYCVASVPSVEALHALLCLTWAEYGAGHDDAFWVYSRMAITMCLDLGIGCESTIQIAATPEVRHRLRLTWWTVVCTADIAAAWATGRSATLDLDQYDTQLPDPADDDISLLFRNLIDLYVLRGKLNRVLDAHVDNRGDSSLDWDLSKLQTNLENMLKALPPTMVFNEENLVAMRDRRMGHVFVQMHILTHAVSALLNRPSLLPSYGLPVPTEGPRAEAARSCAKSVADILSTVERAAPETLCDPFMDLPVVVAYATFIADASASVARATPHARMLTRQWSDAFMGTCKESLVRLSTTWGGAATIDNVLDRHAGMVARVDDAQLAASSWLTTPYNTSNDLNNQQWLLLPQMLDDEASDSSRSSSRELSPLLAPAIMGADSGPKYDLGFNLGGTPFVHEVDDSGVEVNYSGGARQTSFYPLDLLLCPSPGTGRGATTPVLGEDVYDAGSLAGYFDEPQGVVDAGAGADGQLDAVQMWRADSEGTALEASSLWTHAYTPEYRHGYE